MQEKKKGLINGFLIGMLATLGVMSIAMVLLYRSFQDDMRTVIQYYNEQIASKDTIVGRVGAKMNAIEQRMNALYYQDIDWNAIDEAVLDAMLDTLGDPYSVYYNEEEYKELSQGLSGSFKGIGVLVSENEMGALVMQTYDGGSAKEVGIVPEDIICGVNGEDMTGKDVSLITTKIKTTEGTHVTVKVYRPSEEKYFDFKLELRDVQVPTVEYELMEDKIGYIYIDQFASVTGEQFKKALEDLVKQGMESLIIDLRNNTGGNLVTTVEMLDLLLPEGIVTYTKGKDGTGTEYKSDANQMIKMPIGVLVNGYSASASEVFSGALRDFGVAKLVGTTTYGKGIVQSLMSLNDGTALKLTVSHYYTPNGVCIHDVGLEPDVVVEFDADAYKEGIDNQLEEAIKVIREEMKK